MDDDRRKEFEEAHDRLLTANKAISAAGDRALADLKRLQDEAQERMVAAEAEYAARRSTTLSGKTYRAAVDDEKPLFDTTRYVIQTVAVGVSVLTVCKGLIDDPSESMVVLIPSFGGVAIGVVLFFWMLLRVGLLASKAGDVWLTSLKVPEGWIGLRALFVVLVLMSAMMFTAQLAKFTLLSWLATHGPSG